MEDVRVVRKSAKRILKSKGLNFIFSCTRRKVLYLSDAVPIITGFSVCGFQDPQAKASNKYTCQNSLFRVSWYFNDLSSN